MQQKTNPWTWGQKAYAVYILVAVVIIGAWLLFMAPRIGWIISCTGVGMGLTGCGIPAYVLWQSRRAK